MECKLLAEARAKLKQNELMDTLWNVNYDVEKKSFHDVIELIDTLWNVNVIVSLL